MQLIRKNGNWGTRVVYRVNSAELAALLSVERRVSCLLVNIYQWQTVKREMKLAIIDFLRNDDGNQ